jgi:hypothetical protein
MNAGSRSVLGTRPSAQVYDTYTDLIYAYLQTLNPKTELHTHIHYITH